jgi:K+-sensing histidine kinase KdpD
MSSRLPVALGGTVAALAVATGVMYALKPVAPTLSLGVVYTPAVLVVAAAFGMRYALGAAIAAMLAFNFLFLPPVHTLTLADGRNWTALGVYVVTGVFASELASVSRRCLPTRRRSCFTATRLSTRSELAPTGCSRARTTAAVVASRPRFLCC